MKGKIIRLITDKSFGFIRGEDKREYFFHSSAVRNANFRELKEQSQVEFTNSEGEKGPRAEDVYVD